ncbi:SLAP domain-containing protein [Lacticaseibacillus pabuli]|uniref:SLAP domain-containing protein n=1 Tax=Lacticaseibacillus pabuli TaxID=3025672 RepID=A0ABY7WQJ1_9LACO|nr:SLAP domain-containing protein [Lacticaseibacillus sp. KACC 23028]WDF82381.1 SLAP domain-containing protein [Lacticaseibacillus sp. KACC 23028]
MTNKKFTAAAIIAAAITAAPIAATAVGAVAALPVLADTTTQASQTYTISGTATATADGVTVYESKDLTAGKSYTVKQGTKFNVVARYVRGDGNTYYQTAAGEYILQSNVAYVPAVSTSTTTTTNPEAGEQIGTATINYNKNYGIQIWTKDGKFVKFNATDAAAWNKNHPNNKVKEGQPKKLPGQSTWKVFKNTYKANGTTYYNLGGDQYIDANYVILK